MTTEPSPRPWRLDKYDASLVRDADGRFIARADAADAALIVAAVNERDRLRDALERIVRYEDGIVGCIESGHASGIDWDGITFAMIQEARAALCEEDRK